jgi:hypothetical protein
LQRALVWYAYGHQLCDRHPHIYLAGILTCERHIRWGWRTPFSVYHHPSSSFRVSHCNTFISQAAKDSRASQDTLIDVFERMEMFFRRLEVYTEVPLTMEMMDIIIQIMVEVLSILGIATKEIKQGRMSKFLLYKYGYID